jgi:hypothetical protein
VNVLNNVTQEQVLRFAQNDNALRSGCELRDTDSVSFSSDSEQTSEPISGSFGFMSANRRSPTDPSVIATVHSKSFEGLPEFVWVILMTVCERSDR